VPQDPVELAAGDRMHEQEAVFRLHQRIVAGRHDGAVVHHPQDGLTGALPAQVPGSLADWSPRPTPEPG